MKPLAAAGVLLIHLLPCIAFADQSDPGARMERIGNGVFAIIHGNATDEWPHGNTGVIVTDAGVVVIDSTYLPSRARADIALIRSVTGKPVTHLLNTHWHFDHNNGTIEYVRAFPGLIVVSERETAGWIDLNSTYWPRMSTAADSGRQKSLQALEARLASGKREDGQPLTADERKRLEGHVEQRRSELSELATLEAVEPNLVFDRELTLTLGGRRIELRDIGRANSPHDVTIYLPDDRILFAGDIVVQSPFPFVGASWPVAWVEVLRNLEQVEINAMVPGHGPVMRDHTYTRQVRTFLEAVNTRVEAMIRKGLTLEQIQALPELDELRTTSPVWTGPDTSDSDWRYVITTAVERAWRGVRGQG